MAKQDRPQEETSNQGRGASSSPSNQSDDPGRTPGTAEGDEKTVDESLNQKENQTK